MGRGGMSLASSTWILLTLGSKDIRTLSQWVESRMGEILLKVKRVYSQDGTRIDGKFPRQRSDQVLTDQWRGAITTKLGYGCL